MKPLILCALYFVLLLFFGIIGTRLCDVVTWYLSDVVKDEIQTEEQLLAENRIVRHVIKRLVEKDHVLVYLDPDTQDSEPSQCKFFC